MHVLGSIKLDAHGIPELSCSPRSSLRLVSCSINQLPVLSALFLNSGSPVFHFLYSLHGSSALWGSAFSIFCVCDA